MASGLQQSSGESATLDDRCRELGELLGLDHPVSEAVLLASLEDVVYARNLLICRGVPALLAPLLARPPALRESTVRGQEPLSQLAIIKKAGESIWQWTKAGFSNVDDATYGRRLSVCRSCPNLGDAPDGLLHKLARFAVAETKVCTLCSCLITKKARLSSETCPDLDPGRPGFDRWGQAARAGGST